MAVCWLSVLFKLSSLCSGTYSEVFNRLEFAGLAQGRSTRPTLANVLFVLRTDRSFYSGIWALRKSPAPVVGPRVQNFQLLTFISRLTYQLYLDLFFLAVCQFLLLVFEVIE